MRFFMSVVPTLKNESISVSRFLDWCKYKNIFYNNLYLNKYYFEEDNACSCAWVIKMPLITQNLDSRYEIELKKFNLTQYTYLLSY